MLKKNNNYNRNKTAVTVFILSAVLLFLFVTPTLVLASDVIGVNDAAGLGLPDAGGRDIKTILVDIVKYFLTFVGIIAVVVMIYAGWLWMTSAGDARKLEIAKKTLLNAVIGLVIIILSFIIVSWVANIMYGIDGSGGGGGGSRGSGVGLGTSGNSAIESHYPARDQRDVPRNTRIVITFREPVRVADIIDGDYVNDDDNFISIHALNVDANIAGNWLATTTDGQTFRFSQTGTYIGSPSENMWYVVDIGNGIHKANDDMLFTIGSYSWQFEVSTAIDNTPPKIADVIPLPGDTEDRNIVVQINFDEAVDPMSASGPTASFNNIALNNGAPIVGNFYISNQYRTVEFFTDDACGTNSCGNTIYCLPANSNINALVRAATLPIPLVPGSNLSAGSNNGVVDMAGNSFDGNSDGASQGPQTQSGFPPFNANTPEAANHGDDYVWNFNTNDTINITPPEIDSVNPGYNANGIGEKDIPQAIFSKILMCSSLKKDNIELKANPADNEVFYWLTAENEPEGSPTYTRSLINHRDFITEMDTTYAPIYGSGVKDIYQNCYAPAAGPACTPTATNPYCCNGTAQANCEP